MFLVVGLPLVFTQTCRLLIFSTLTQRQRHLLSWSCLVSFQQCFISVISYQTTDNSFIKISHSSLYCIHSSYRFSWGVRYLILLPTERMNGFYKIQKEYHNIHVISVVQKKRISRQVMRFLQAGLLFQLASLKASNRNQSSRPSLISIKATSNS